MVGSPIGYRVTGSANTSGFVGGASGRTTITLVSLVTGVGELLKKIKKAMPATIKITRTATVPQSVQMTPVGHLPFLDMSSLLLCWANYRDSEQAKVMNPCWGS